MTQEEFENKWYHKLVNPKGRYEIPNKEYFVTACLLEDNGAKFAIMAIDYNLENKQWITFNLSKEELDGLDQDFEILGDYNNIDFELLFEIIDIWKAQKDEFENLEEGEYITVNTKEFVKGATTTNNRIPIKAEGYNVGDWLYDIGWTSTTGEKLRKSYLVKKEEGLNADQVREKFKNVRYWIEGGMYHFADVDKQ